MQNDGLTNLNFHLNHVAKNLFRLRAEYRRIAEYLGPNSLLNALTDSQQSQVSKVLQLFWTLGLSPPPDAYLHATPYPVVLPSTTASCIGLEKKVGAFCDSILSRSKDQVIRRVASEVRETARYIHLPRLLSYAEGIGSPPALSQGLNIHDATARAMPPSHRNLSAMPALPKRHAINS